MMVLEAERKASDGYSNAAAFLGDSSRLMSAGTFVRTGLTSNSELLTTMYRVNWLCKRIIDMPTEDMTRAWYRFSGNIPEDKLHRLRRLEAEHSVKQELANAIRWGRLYGGALALMVIRNEEEYLDQPLDLEMLIPESFQGLLVLDRTQGVSPSVEKVTDLDDPDFGLPMYYTVTLETDEVRMVRMTEADAPALSSYLSSYIAETPGVFSIENAEITIINSTFRYACTALTSDGKVKVSFGSGDL